MAQDAQPAKRGERTTRSPDSPVVRREDDLLRRWNLAKTIYDLVRGCPREWSPRVGLYGGWGEGKTSVLRFVEGLAREQGVPLLWFSPWNAQDRVELWMAFSAELERHLGYRPGRERRVRRWLGRQWRRLSPFLRAASNVPASALPPEIPPHSAEMIRGVFSLAETLVPGLTKDVPAQREDVERQLLAIPEDTRLIVVIDDLDRGDPELMPHLLLALREVFDLPGCAFIVAFDPRTVAEALPSAHPGWKPTPEFLEKIIQFSFWLPTPTREDVLALAREEVKTFPRVIVDVAALAEIADLLPSNPRRLKDFFRGLWRLSPTLARHDASEVKWMPLLLVELMRALSPAATQALFKDEKFRRDLGVATFFPEDSKSAAGAKVIKELREHATTILKGVKCPDDVLEGLLRLVDAFRDRVSMVAESNIAYWAHLDEMPPVLTWKEFNSLVAAWRPNPSAARLAQLVEAQARAIGCSTEAAYRELFETAVMYRSNAISRAAEVVPDADIGVEMDEADVGLAILKIVVCDLHGFSREPNVLTEVHFKQLLEQFGHWAHFRNHPRYVIARDAERRLLLDAAKEGASFASEVLESMQPWSGLFGAFSPERAELKQAAVQALCPYVFDNLIMRFARKDGISALWGKGRHLVEKHFLFRRDGGFYTEARIARLKQLAEDAKTVPTVQENFYEYLRLLAYGLKGNSETLTGAEVSALARDADIVSPAWRAATAQPLQPRVVGDLRETRLVLAKQLPEGDALTLPSWWPAELPAAETAPAVPAAEAHAQLPE
jgi:KAP-like P-loop domain-containing protein